MDSALKIARIKAKTDQLLAAKEFALAVIDNPAVELVAGTLLIEYFAKADEGGWAYEILQGAGKTVLEAALVVVCTAKAIAPALDSPAASALVGRFLP